MLGEKDNLIKKKTLQKLDSYKLILGYRHLDSLNVCFLISSGCATLFAESLTTSFMGTYSANVISVELRRLKVMAVAYVSLSNHSFSIMKNIKSPSCIISNVYEVAFSLCCIYDCKSRDIVYVLY